MTGSINRRTFVKAGAAAGLSVGVAPFRIARGGVSANDKVVVAFLGVNSRGTADVKSFAAHPNAEIAAIVDVDERATAKAIQEVEAITGKAPQGYTDLREVLERPDIDAVGIAMPDHWHTPAATLAMQAGKHVYLEKPGSHNAAESQLLVKAQQRYGKTVQLGTQQRSMPETIHLVQRIREGLIGRAYYAYTFYNNTRGSIGNGQTAAVPSWLNWELWQGPAPHTSYRDNVVHYNWHWFKRWGTGEVANNGTHELDVARWALGVDYPTRVTSSGGRYHFDDDWEFWDTQLVTYDYDDDKTIVWEGRSCNGLSPFGRGRGTQIHGTEGSVLVDRNGYIVYDLEGRAVETVEREEQVDGTNVVGEDALTDLHTLNFLNAIVHGEALRQPVEQGQVSVLMTHLGNIAQEVGRALYLDPRTGRIIGDPEAMLLWGRAYQPGWAPSV